jgi:hypothetical protein
MPASPHVSLFTCAGHALARGLALWLRLELGFPCERWLVLQEGQAVEEPPPAPLSAAEAASVLGGDAPAQAQQSEWAARVQRERVNWAAQGNPLRCHRVSQEAHAENARCVGCGVTEHVRLRCRSCSSDAAPLSTLLCASCDRSRHRYAHFHMREVFIDGYWQRQPMHMELQQSDDGVLLGSSRPAPG